MSAMLSRLLGVLRPKSVPGGEDGETGAESSRLAEKTTSFHDVRHCAPELRRRQRNGAGADTETFA